MLQDAPLCHYFGALTREFDAIPHGANDLFSRA